MSAVFDGPATKTPKPGAFEAEPRVGRVQVVDERRGGQHDRQVLGEPERGAIGERPAVDPDRPVLRDAEPPRDDRVVERAAAARLGELRVAHVRARDARHRRVDALCAAVGRIRGELGLERVHAVRARAASARRLERAREVGRQIEAAEPGFVARPGAATRRAARAAPPRGSRHALRPRRLQASRNVSAGSGGRARPRPQPKRPEHGLGQPRERRAREPAGPRIERRPLQHARGGARRPRARRAARQAPHARAPGEQLLVQVDLHRAHVGARAAQAARERQARVARRDRARRRGSSRSARRRSRRSCARRCGGRPGRC